MTVKTLKAMTAEVADVNTQKGWRAQARTLGEDCVLLHEEISEAFSAWRRWGFSDATSALDTLMEDGNAGTLPKPEGVGSELADILIRLLDTLDRNPILANHFFTDAPNRTLADLTGPADRPEDVEHFATVIDEMHGGVVDFRRGQMPIGVLFILLAATAKAAGIDLQQEYERKIAYNRTRPYRHGNKRL